MSMNPSQEVTLMVEYHRNPTKYEIKFGDGAIHYISVSYYSVRKPNGELKKWFKGDDGLRYYR